MDESSLARLEFDRAEWPDIIGCKVMPRGNPDSAEVEIAGADNNNPILQVPKEAVISMNMPQIVDALHARNVPGEVKKELEDNISLCLLSCRVIERFDDKNLVRIEVPVVSGQAEFLILAKSLGRRR